MSMRAGLWRKAPPARMLFSQVSREFLVKMQQLVKLHLLKVSLFSLARLINFVSSRRKLVWQAVLLNKKES